MWNSLLWILTVVIFAAVFFMSLARSRSKGFSNEWIPLLIWPIIFFLLLISTYVAYESVFNSPSRGLLIVLFLINTFLIVVWGYFYFYKTDYRLAWFISIILILLLLVQCFVSAVNLDGFLAPALLFPVIVWFIIISWFGFREGF